MAQRGMGIPMTMFRGANGNEELWSGPWRVEVKSGAQVGPIATRYLSAEAQMEAAKRIGDTRPGFVVAMPSGWGSEGLLICRLSRFQAVVDAAIEWSQNQ